MKSDFQNQVRLLLRCLPIVNAENKFVLTGGTAINLFLQNMPRFSVDIDLIWNFVSDRQTALNGITESLKIIENKLLKQPFINKIIPQKIGDRYTKLNVMSGNTSIKIEVSDVGRGCFLPIESRELCASACDIFETKFSIHLAPYEEIYAGKIRAALERQHPRDLFDIKILFENNGLTEKIMDSVVIYLLQGNRPFHEYLSPNHHDLEKAFQNEFLGMTQKEVTYEELIVARQKVIQFVNKNLSEQNKHFVLSFYDSEIPDWSLSPFKNIDTLPAIKWKIKNIETMGKINKNKYAEKLRALLF